MIFAANVMSGIVHPYFSLYAKSLGAGLALIGVMVGAGSVTGMAASVPVGWWADSRPIRRVLLVGMVLRVLVPLSLIVLPDARLLAVPKILSGVAVVATTMVGASYVAGRVPTTERGVAIGVYTTAMGTGFALGSFLGGWLIPTVGYVGAFAVAAAVALLGLFVSLWGLDRSGRSADTTGARAGGVRQRLMALVSNPQLLGACIASFGNGVWFSSLMSYFPLYASSLSVRQTTIGMLLSLRILASALSRFPAGLLSARVPNLWLVTGALALAALSIATLGVTEAVALFAVLLVAEGLAYGAFLTAGRGLVIERVAEHDAGTALGVYNMAGGVGSILGPVLLGLLAERLGLEAVFWGIGLVLALCLLAAWAIESRPKTGTHL
jgi:MFS family permease